MEDYTKFVQQLRNAAKWMDQHGRNTNEVIGVLCDEAANIIDRLIMENSELRSTINSKDGGSHND